MCQLWSHVNPAVEKRWQRALPLQCLWLVVTISIYFMWLVVTIFVSPPSFSVSFAFYQIKSQCLRPLLQNERDKSASSQTKEAPGEFCNNHERVDDNDIDCW